MPDFARIFDILGSVAARNDVMTRQQDFELQALTSGFGQGAFSMTAPANVNTPDPKIIAARGFQENTNDIYGYAEADHPAPTVAKTDVTPQHDLLREFARTSQETLNIVLSSLMPAAKPASDSIDSINPAPNNVVPFKRKRRKTPQPL